MATGFFTSAGSFASAVFYVLLPSASSLLPVIPDITKSFHIRKLVARANNITSLKTLKDIL